MINRYQLYSKPPKNNGFSELFANIFAVVTEIILEIEKKMVKVRSFSLGTVLV
jgi:hypothetical protein